MNKCLLHLLLAMLGVLGQGGTNPTPDDVTTPTLNLTLISSTEEPVASSSLDPVDLLNSTTLAPSNVTDILTSTAGPHPDVNATTAAVGTEDNSTSTTPAINVTTEIPTTSKKPAPIMITDLPHPHHRNYYKPIKVLTTPNAPPPTPDSSTTPSTPANGGFKFPDMKIQVPKIEIVHKP